MMMNTLVDTAAKVTILELDFVEQVMMP